jgi:hypothetical protein
MKTESEIKKCIENLDDKDFVDAEIRKYLEWVLEYPNQDNVGNKEIIEMNKNLLSDIEYTLLWMAIRYAMNRQSISCVMLPSDIVKNYWYRLTDNQKISIYDDIENHLKYDYFKIDYSWLKFSQACNIKGYFNIKILESNKIDTCFTCTNERGEKRIYSLNTYIKQPSHEISYIEDKIKIL